MNATNEAQTPASGDPPKKDNRIRTIFIVVLVVVAAGVYLIQRRPAERADWPVGDERTLQAAKAENRPVVLFFKPDSADATADRMVTHVFDKSMAIAALKKGNYVTAIVPMNLRNPPPLAKTYGIKELPTLLKLSSTGVEQARKSGYMGEVELNEMLTK